MSSVLTLAVSVAAAAGAIAAIRFVDRKQRELKDVFKPAEAKAGSDEDRLILDYERDPATGVYRPEAGRQDARR